MAVRLVERCACWFSDPVERLQFLQRATSTAPSALEGSGQFGHTMRWALARWDFSRRLLPLAGLVILTALAVVGTVVMEASSRRGVSTPSIATVAPTLRSPPVELPSAGPASVPRIWIVEAGADFDLYSNGLRVENQFATSTEPRRYRAFLRGPQDRGAAPWRTDPAGIVFHTTESHMAPFEQDQNRTLRRAGEGLLEYVARNRSYHFVIDRFGRVFRIVRESDRANHAGHSIWADQTWIYLDLNPVFFGVAFEAQTRPEGEPSPINPAQVHAGRILTDMLRSRYSIAAEDCVAHAQVSVCPSNRHAAYHTDWAAHLPFHELGLGDNYALPLPSVVLFGFATDPSLGSEGSPVFERALMAGESQLRDQAAAQGLAIDRYRQSLQTRYLETVRALAANAPIEENN